MDPSNLILAKDRIHRCLKKARNHLNLAGLGLGDADLAGIADFKDLTGLQFLDLTGNALTKQPACVGTFTELCWLGLNFNRLTDVAGVEKLAKLQRLYLRGNALAALPEDIGKLEALVELDLTGNAIIRLPDSMGSLAALEQIALEEKHLVPDQRAAWEQQHWQSLREHLLRSTSAGQPALVTYAAKVILIGEQDNGKTCLQMALRGLQPQAQNPSTEGMNRVPLHLTLVGDRIASEVRKQRPGPQEEVIDLQLWDMGGQHDYKQIHQLLFSQGAIYLAVAKARDGGSMRELEEWLDLVHRRTQQNATVIVVFTYNKPDASVKLADLERKFLGLRFKGLYMVDSLENIGINELRRRLAEIVREEDGPFARRWQRGWVEVFHELEAMNEPFVDRGTVVGICERHGITAADEQEILVRTGHYVGSWLWREDTPAGKMVVVLEPQWLNRAVARLLEHEDTQAAHGLIGHSELKKLWLKQARDDEPGFPEDTHEMLIQLMEINELAYRPHQQGQVHGSGDLLLVTQMVEGGSVSEMDTEWERIKPANFMEARQVIAFVHPNPSLAFGSVPELIYLLIFRLRSHSLGRKNYCDARHWQNGLLVSDNFGSVGRIELKDNQLHVTVRYVLTDQLFYVISNQIGPDEDALWNGLRKMEYVFCGDACLRSDVHKGNGLVSLVQCHLNMAKENPFVNCGWQLCGESLEIAKVLPKARIVTPQRNEMTAKLDQLIALIEQGERTVVEMRQTIIAMLEGIGSSLEELRTQSRMHADEIIVAMGNVQKSKPSLFSVLPVEKEWWRLSGLAEIEVDIIIWCEWSLVPVFFHGEKYGDGLRGIVRVKMPREWVYYAKNATQFTIWGLLALKTGGLGTAVAPAFGGKDLLADPLRKWLNEAFKISTQTRNMLKEYDGDRIGATAPGAAGGDLECDPAAERIYGKPLDDKQVIDQLRKKFFETDPGWGGLEPKCEESAWSWRHPGYEKFGRRK
ncbi:MAG: hypothetical protein NTW21_19120 [Verrucomicrobia bacterium]|nr:hypothetical protein [Verrucomicrobiota bacterium]